MSTPPTRPEIDFPGGGQHAGRDPQRRPVAVGEVVADLMTGRTPFVDVTPMDKRRFTTTGLRKELNVI